MSPRLRISLIGAQLALVMVAACRSQVGSPPAIDLRNPDLVSWPQGPFAAPDGWSLSGPGSGSIQPGPAVPGGRAFSAAISSTSGDVALCQDVRDARLVEGHALRFAAWVRAARTGMAQLTIGVMDQHFATRWYSGAGEWQLVTATGTIPVNAPFLRFCAWARTVTETTAVGGFSVCIDPAPPIGVRNLDLSAWSGSEAAPPDGWEFGGEGSGSIHRGPSSVPGARFSAIVSGSRGDLALYQDLRDVRTLRGRRFRFDTWVKTWTANSVQLAVSGASSWFSSQWHSANGEWELLTAVGIVPNDASWLRFHAWARNGSSMEVGGSSVWVEPMPPTHQWWIWVGILVFAVSVGLVVPSSRRRLLKVARRLSWSSHGIRYLDALRERLRPERFFLVVGSLFGLAFVVLTPPLQTPDEPAHFFRAFAISEGHLLPEVRIVNGKEVTGAQIPKSLLRMDDALGRTELAFHAERKFDLHRILSEVAVPLAAEEREFNAFGPPSVYAPVPYLPQALAIAAGRVTHQSPLVLLYLARLANLLCWLAGMWFAIRLTPVFRWGFAFFALSPMSVFLAGSAAPDAVTNWCSFLVGAAFLEAAFRNDAPLLRNGIARPFLLSFVLSLCKQVYFWLSLLFLLVPAKKLAGVWRKMLLLAALLALQIGATLLWGYVAVKGHPPVRTGANPTEQIAFMMSDPLRMVVIMLRTHKVYANFYLSSFVGNLGWLDVVLPSWSLVSYLFVALILSIFYGIRPGMLTVGHRIVLLSSAALAWSTILGFEYLVWSQVGANVIDGSMGRFLIPLSPLVFLAIAGGRIRPDAETIKLRVAGFLSVVLATALLCTLRRYYV